MKNSTLFSIFKVLCAVAGFLTISHFTQAQTLKTATGSANNFILSLGQNLGGSYPSGLSFTFISNQTITGAATINVNSTGVKNLVKNVNQSLAANDILAGQAVQVLYDGTNFQVLNVGSATSTSSGSGNIHAFRAKITNASQIIPNATVTPVVFDAEDFDLQNDHNNSTGQFVCQDPGIYQFTGVVRLSTSLNPINVGILLNGTLLEQGSYSTTEYFSIVSGILKLNTGDIVQLAVAQYTGSSQTLWYSPASPVGCVFSGFKINGGGTLTVTSFSGSTSSGISTLNGLTSTSQNFSTSSTGTSVNIVSSGNTHNFNIPLASIVGGNNITVTGSFPLYTVSGLAGGTSTSQWVTTTGGIYYGGGNIGLKIDPQYDLHIFNPTQGLYARFETPITTGAFNALEFKTGIYNLSSTRSNAIWQLGMVQNGTASNPNDRFFFGRSGISSSDFGIYRDGNVGIGLSGIAVPNEKLTVQGNITASGIGYFGTIAGLALNGAAAGSIVTVDGLGKLGFGSSSSSSQWISTTGGIYYNSGKVGIGTSTPYSNFELSSGLVSDNTLGILNTNSVSGNVGIELRSYAGGGALQYIDFSSNSTNQATPDFVNRISSSANGLNLQTQSATGLFLQNSNAFIGIGTSSPLANLDVNGNARFVGPVSITGLAGATTQALGVNNLGQLVTIAGTTSTSQWVSTTGGAIFYNGGNVGINTTSVPTEKLFLNGNIGLSIGSTIGLNPSGDRFTYGSGTFPNYGLGWYNDTWTGGGPTTYVAGWGGLKVFVSATNSSQPVLSIDYLRNVSFAGSNFTVNSPATFTNPVTISSFAGAGTQALGVNNVGQLVTIAGTTSTSQWVSTTAGIYYSTGNVSIGTNNPTQKLHLSGGNALITGTANFSTAGDRAYLYLGDVNHYISAIDGSGVSIGTYSKPDAVFLQQVSGNLGIGTTAPGTSLDVNGNARFNGPVTISGLAGATTQALGVNNLGQLVTITGGTGTSQWANGAGGIYYNSGIVSVTGGRLYVADLSGTSGGSNTFWVTSNDTWQTSSNLFNTTNIASIAGWGLTQAGSANTQVAPGTFALYNNSYKFIIDPNGNVGIGSSIAARNPTSKLYVEGSTQITGPVTISALATGGATQALGVNNLGQLVTIGGTSSAITSLNSLTTTSQSFSTSSTGTSINISSSGSTHNFNIPVVTVVGGNNVTVSGGFPSYTISGLGGTSTSQWVNSAATTPGIYYTGGKVGIGLPDPTHFSNVPLIVRGATAPQAIFGDNQSGVTITAGNPGIWFNSYFYSGGMRNMIGGYASTIGQNPSSGIFSLYITTATGTANTINPSIVAFNVYPTGNTEFLGLVTTSGLTIKNLTGPGTVTVDGLGNLGVGVPSASSSQWTSTTSGTIYYNGGNVEIGYPAGGGGVLNVASTGPGADFRAGYGTAGAALRLGVKNGVVFNTPELVFYAQTTGGMAYIMQSIVYGSGPGATVLINPTAGNVGIGVSASPVAKLTIGGSASISGVSTIGGLNVRNLTGPGTVTVDGLGNLGVGAISGSVSNLWSVSGSNLVPTSTYGINLTSTTSSYMIGGIDVVRLMPNSSYGNSIFLGGSGNQAATGYSNVMIGVSAGQNITSGNYNSFVGAYAGQSNSTGSFNVFNGYGPGWLNTSGSHNIFTGFYAGYSNVSGNYNLYAGDQSGYNALGGFNAFYGAFSGQTLVNGSYNTAIGSNSDIIGIISNASAIGAYATVGGSNMMALGASAGSPYAVNVGIGTGLPQNTIDVVGGARIRNLSVSGAVFANANGDLYISTSSSSNYWTISGTNLQSIDPTYSINISTSSGYYKYLGYNALSMNINSVSGNSIYLGGAGSLASSGAGNVFIGDLSGINNSSGTNNVFTGLRAGNANSTGSYNTFNGAFAGYNLQNTNFNSFFGYGAGVNSNTGADNTFIGGYAGQTNTSGSGNLALGVQADFTSNNLFQAIAIGYHATVGGSNMMALGGQGVYAVKVGIGTGLPSTTLDVVGGARIRNLSVAGAVFATSNGDLYVNTATSTNLWTVSGTSLTPSTASYGVNVGTNITTTGLVNISSTTNSGMVISSYSIPANTGALMVNSYSSSTAGIGGFVTGPNAVGIYGQATNGLSSAIEGNNTGGGSAIKATGTGAVSPVVQIDNNGSGGTGLRINLSQGLNTATGLMIISSSTTTSQAMDITGKIQFRNYTSGTLTVDGLGNLGVSTATSNVGAGSGFLATSTVPQANISSGVWTLALFGNEVFDDASKYDNTTTFDYTAPANGVYQINASVPFSNIGQVDIAIAVNAVNMIVNSASTSPNTGIVTSIPISGILKLTSGQKVTIQVRQFTGGLVGTASSNTGANASFSMVKLY